ncbi:MAG: valine--tRNA ligase [bacterium]|nr:valine--tRNA ligase [bacterium]
MKITKTYEPNNYEPDIYALWEASGAFESSGVGPKYSIVMPPPNANGNLHIGHGLMAAVEDILVRYHKMKGYDAVYLPGADHAGFETWVVYERLLNAEGKSRFDYSRDELYQQVWDFVAKQRGGMELQLRALGVGADWKNSTFTLDQKVVSRVYKTFEKLWNEDLIYRGERIVNYSTKYQTSYADIEVDYKEEKGKLWTISYPVIGEFGEAEQYMLVSTTRPETMLGDTALAVNPTDERYEKLIGRKVRVPLINREITIIADEYADPNYGTGVVKITPFHDPNDFEVGNRHNLPKIQVIGFDGKMNENAGAYQGLEVMEARKKIIEDLRKNNALFGEENITHVVGYDYKSGEPIQPLVKEQWFISTKPLAAKALEALRNDEIKFTPENKKNVLMNYLENIRDWNVSRQIPWGIPIPAFQNVDDENDWIFNENVHEKEIEVDGKIYRRDEDTLDTWFSSGQWPFITTDFLENGELSKFYPNSVMETGHDLIFPWISRMIMLGIYCTGQVPFREVYLHGMVLDEHGQKMSKSKGNVINPMDVIAEFGSDAFRLGIIAARSAGQNQAFSKNKVVAGRNFCNKLWNISRFISEKVGEIKSEKLPEAYSPADHWIVRELDRATAELDNHMTNYRFAEASETVYHTIWSTVADWYIEASKTQENPELLAWVLESCLKLAHPFAPFVTETIWQTLPWTEGVLANEKLAKSLEFNELEATNFERIQDLVNEIRFITAELPGNQRYNLLFENDLLIRNNAETIRHLARVPQILETDAPQGFSLAVSGLGAYLDVPAKVLAEYKTELEKMLTAVQAQIENLERRLSNENYISKAPAELVKETRQDLSEKRAQLAKIERGIANLNN